MRRRCLGESPEAFYYNFNKEGVKLMLSKFGGWEVKFSTTEIPQKVATALGYLEDDVFHTQYRPAAYLASQPVNGINHAILAEQTVTNGKDAKNAVVMVWNEKPKSLDVALTDIFRIVESGGPLGGTVVTISEGIPDEAKEALKSVLAEWTGIGVEPLMFLGHQMAKGINYKLLAKTFPIYRAPNPELTVVTVNSLIKKMEFEPVFRRGVNDPKEPAAAEVTA